MRAVLPLFLAIGAMGAPPTTPTEAPMPVPADLMRIVESVQQKILRLTEYGVFDNIRFSVKGQAIILTGEASRPILKSAAESAVKSIEGVERVENRIEVLPFRRFDEDIRFRAYRAIYSHPALNRYDPNRGSPLFTSAAALELGLSVDPPLGYHPIHIIVRDSKLKLTGVVGNIGDKTIAGLIANGIPNVFEVVNDLAVADEMMPVRHARKSRSTGN
jgi:hypothetical protein